MLFAIALLGCAEAEHQTDTGRVPDAGSPDVWDTEVVVPTDEQAESGPVDFFVLLDSGASMYEEQHMLANAIPETLDALDGEDWTLTVVTTDALDAPTYMEPGVTALDIRQALLVGTGGPIEAQGYATLARAMGEYPVRPGALVSLLIVSDGDDYSDITVEEMAGGLGPGAVVSAIISSDPACGPVDGDIGHRHLELIAAVDGAHSSICEQTLTPAVLAHIATSRVEE